MKAHRLSSIVLICAVLLSACQSQQAQIISPAPSDVSKFEEAKQTFIEAKELASGVKDQYVKNQKKGKGMIHAVLSALDIFKNSPIYEMVEGSFFDQAFKWIVTNVGNNVDIGAIIIAVLTTIYQLLFGGGLAYITSKMGSLSEHKKKIEEGFDLQSIFYKNQKQITEVSLSPKFKEIQTFLDTSGKKQIKIIIGSKGVGFQSFIKSFIWKKLKEEKKIDNFIYYDIKKPLIKDVSERQTSHMENIQTIVYSLLYQKDRSWFIGMMKGISKRIYKIIKFFFKYFVSLLIIAVVDIIYLVILKFQKFWYLGCFNLFFFYGQYIKKIIKGKQIYLDIKICLAFVFLPLALTCFFEKLFSLPEQYYFLHLLLSYYGCTQLLLNLTIELQVRKKQLQWKMIILFALITIFVYFTSFIWINFVGNMWKNMQNHHFQILFYFGAFLVVCKRQIIIPDQKEHSNLIIVIKNFHVLEQEFICERFQQKLNQAKQEVPKRGVQNIQKKVQSLEPGHQSQSLNESQQQYFLNNLSILMNDISRLQKNQENKILVEFIIVISNSSFKRKYLDKLMLEEVNMFKIKTIFQLPFEDSLFIISERSKLKQYKLKDYMHFKEELVKKYKITGHFDKKQNQSAFMYKIRSLSTVFQDFCNKKSADEIIGLYLKYAMKKKEKKKQIIEQTKKNELQKQPQISAEQAHQENEQYESIFVDNYHFQLIADIFPQGVACSNVLRKFTQFIALFLNNSKQILITLRDAGMDIKYINDQREIDYLLNNQNKDKAYIDVFKAVESSIMINIMRLQQIINFISQPKNKCQDNEFMNYIGLYFGVLNKEVLQFVDRKDQVNPTIQKIYQDLEQVINKYQKIDFFSNIKPENRKFLLDKNQNGRYHLKKGPRMIVLKWDALIEYLENDNDWQHSVKQSFTKCFVQNEKQKVQGIKPQEKNNLLKRAQRYYYEIIDYLTVKEIVFNQVFLCKSIAIANYYLQEKHRQKIAYKNFQLGQQKLIQSLAYIQRKGYSKDLDQLKVNYSIILHSFQHYIEAQSNEIDMGASWIKQTPVKLEQKHMQAELSCHYKKYYCQKKNNNYVLKPYVELIQLYWDSFYQAYKIKFEKDAQIQFERPGELNKTNFLAYWYLHEKDRITEITVRLFGFQFTEINKMIRIIEKKLPNQYSKLTKEVLPANFDKLEEEIEIAIGQYEKLIETYKELFYEINSKYISNLYTFKDGRYQLTPKSIKIIQIYQRYCKSSDQNKDLESLRQMSQALLSKMIVTDTLQIDEKDKQGKEILRKKIFVLGLFLSKIHQSAQVNQEKAQQVKEEKAQKNSQKGLQQKALQNQKK